MYINLWYNSRPSRNYVCVQISQTIDGFRQNDKPLRLLEFIKHYKQNPLEKLKFYF